MIRKLAVCIVVLTVAATAVLMLRQQRMVAVAEMTSAAQRASSLDGLLWRVRVEIAALSEPGRIEFLAQGLSGDVGELVPLSAVEDGGAEGMAMVDVVDDGGGVVR